MKSFLQRNVIAVVAILVVVAFYLWRTRQTVKVIGTVDASGDGMTINGQPVAYIAPEPLQTYGSLEV